MCQKSQSRRAQKPCRNLSPPFSSFPSLFFPLPFPPILFPSLRSRTPSNPVRGLWAIVKVSEDCQSVGSYEQATANVACSYLVAARGYVQHDTALQFLSLLEFFMKKIYWFRSCWLGETRCCPVDTSIFLWRWSVCLWRHNGRLLTLVAMTLSAEPLL